MSEHIATAEYLGKFRAELVDQGFPPDEVADLVRMAAREILSNEGLGVKA